ncbi:MAG: glycosyltransferase 87 family protein [Propionibacteriaceae bacterium]
MLPSKATLIRSGQELLPPIVMAVLLLPWIIATGVAHPWLPATIDFDVYRQAAQDMLASRSIYDTVTQVWRLKFIYPPIAAVLMSPIALGSLTLWRLIWTVGTVWAQQLVLRRCGVSRGWALGLFGAVVVIAVEPIRTTLGYGQVNTFLMALVIADLLPIKDSERRYIPRGTLIGLAAAIKLTPLIFVAFLWFAGKRRAAFVAVGSFIFWTLLGAILLFPETIRFVSELAHGHTGTTSPIYLGNQSFLGLIARSAGSDTGIWMKIGLLVGACCGLAMTLVASRWYETAPAMSVALVGMAGCLASPLSWTHHHVWVIVVIASLICAEKLPKGIQILMAVWSLWVSGCFILFMVPFGGGREYHYTVGENMVANFTVLVTIMIFLAMAIAAPRLSRDQL